MIICVVAVGDKYIDLCLPAIKKIIDFGITVKVLTDKPELFNCDTYKYDKKIFSFFEKLIFTCEISEKLKTDVLYVDADRLKDVSLNFFKIFKGDYRLVFFDYWQIQLEKDKWEKWENFTDYKLEYYNPFIDFCEKNNFNINSLKCFWEGVFYLPYLDGIGTVLYDIENIKPVFEYMSVVGNNLYFGKLGESEGLALSYVMNKNNLNYTLLTLDYVFNTRLI